MLETFGDQVGSEGCVLIFSPVLTGSKQKKKKKRKEKKEIQDRIIQRLEWLRRQIVTVNFV